jgi:hypothetical protein
MSGVVLTLALMSCTAKSPAHPGISATDTLPSPIPRATAASRTPTPTNVSLCDAVGRVFMAITAFESNRSPTFDDTAKAEASRLLAETDKAIEIVGSKEFEPVLRSIDKSVRMIVSQALADSATELAALKSATAQYVSASTTFKALRTQKCG